MAPKRATVPSDTFAKSPSALDKLTGRAHTENTVIPQNCIKVQMKQRERKLRSICGLTKSTSSMS